MKKNKLTIKKIILNFNKIQINNAPDSLISVKALTEFINKQGFYLKPGTLAHHKKQIYKWSLAEYANTYVRGGNTGINTIYCKQFIEDCLKISLCFRIGIKEFERCTTNRRLGYTCK